MCQEVLMNKPNEKGRLALFSIQTYANNVSRASINECFSFVGNTQKNV